MEIYTEVHIVERSILQLAVRHFGLSWCIWNPYGLYHFTKGEVNTRTQGTPLPISNLTGQSCLWESMWDWFCSGLHAIHSIWLQRSPRGHMIAQKLVKLAVPLSFVHLQFNEHNEFSSFVNELVTYMLVCLIRGACFCKSMLKAWWFINGQILLKLTLQA